jgi:hypothetical protein
MNLSQISLVSCGFVYWRAGTIIDRMSASGPGIEQATPEVPEPPPLLDGGRGQRVKKARMVEEPPGLAHQDEAPKKRSKSNKSSKAESKAANTSGDALQSPSASVVAIPAEQFSALMKLAALQTAVHNAPKKGRRRPQTAVSRAILNLQAAPVPPRYVR